MVDIRYEAAVRRYRHPVAAMADSSRRYRISWYDVDARLRRSSHFDIMRRRRLRLVLFFFQVEHGEVGCH
jgi:hypothetical protein